MRRRKFLLTGIVTAGVAGCSEIDYGAGSIGGNSASGPEGTAETFFHAIGERDANTVNRLRHTDGDIPEVTDAELEEELQEYDIDVDQADRWREGDDYVEVRVSYTIVDREQDEEHTTDNTLELRQEDGEWRVRSVSDPIIDVSEPRQTMPNAQFNAEFESSGTMTFTHNGGDQIDAATLLVEIDDEQVDADGLEDSETIQAGNTIRVRNPDGDWDGEVVQLVWSSGEESAVLRSASAPN